MPEKEEYLIRHMNNSSVMIDTISFSKQAAEIVVNNLLLKGFDITDIQVWSKVALNLHTSISLG